MSLSRLLPLLLLLSGCVHQVTGVVGSHEPQVWVVRTNYHGVQEVYRCTDEGNRPRCRHAPMVDE